MSKLQTKNEAGVSDELPGIPDGTVPKSIRTGAESVVRQRLWIKEQKEELAQLEETLLVNMNREHCQVAVVIHDGKKYRIFALQPEQKIQIKEEGIAPENSFGKKN